MSQIKLIEPTSDPMETKQHLFQELDEICEAIYERLRDANFEQYIESVRALQEGGKEIASWASEYDYKDIQANGYWSILRIGIKLGRLLLEKYKDTPDEKEQKNLVNILEYALIAISVVRILREDSQKAGPGEDGKYSLNASSLSFFVDLFGLLLSIDNEKIASAYGSYCGFWLCSRSRSAMIILVSTLSVLTSSLFDSYKCVLNAEYRGVVFADIIKNADVSFVKRLGGILECRFYKTFLPIFLYGSTPRVIKDIYVPRQKEWLLSPLNKKVMKSLEMNDNFYKSGKEYVRCKVYRSDSKPRHPNKLIFHCHGGGFICGTPDSHEVYLRDWANKMQGITILSIDYTLSPEGKFPVALQEILDVYLWLINETSMVTKMMNIDPTEIVFVGDSAGGNLLTALCLILTDINKRSPEYQIPIPKSLVCLYTPFNITLHLTPSMILASCDCLISAGVMLSCFEAYLPILEMDEHDTHLHKTYIEGESIFEDLTNLNFYEFVKKSIKYMKDLTLRKPSSVPWYRADKTSLRSKVDQLYKITSNPYISPLCYPDFESLAGIDLHLIALHYDPFLDDNVSMARKWKGKVTLDIVDGLQHGFLNFLPFIDEAKKANELCVRRIQQCFESNL